MSVKVPGNFTVSGTDFVVEVATDATSSAFATGNEGYGPFFNTNQAIFYKQYSKIILRRMAFFKHHRMLFSHIPRLNTKKEGKVPYYKLLPFFFRQQGSLLVNTGAELF